MQQDGTQGFINVSRQKIKLFLLHLACDVSAMLLSDASDMPVMNINEVLDRFLEQPKLHFSLLWFR